MRCDSLVGRLLLAMLGGMVAAGVAVIASSALLSSPERVLQAELHEEVQHVEEGLDFDSDGRLKVTLPDYALKTYDAMPRDAAFIVFDEQGAVAASSIDGPALQALREAADDVRRIRLDAPSGVVDLQVERTTVARAHRTLRIAVARSDRLTATLDGFASKLSLQAGGITVALALLVFVAVVVLTTRRLVRPIREISARAASIGPRNLTARLDDAGLPREIRPLVAAFNHTLERLEQGFRVQQEFLATAAHELKTPLSLLRAELELGGAVNTDALLRDTTLMARQVSQLLHLAEASEGHNYVFAPLSLEAAARDAAGYMTRLADRTLVHLQVEAGEGAPVQADEGAPVQADEGAVFVLMKNLLENAIQHAPPGSTVTLAVDADGFSVRDEGPGVPDSARAHLFTRFWRGRSGGDDGAGLGLAICDEICRAHGWAIAVDTRCDTGARFVVSLLAGDARG